MGQSIIITGASSGIGEALAHEMARRGYRLGLTARRVEQLQAIRGAILAHTPDAKIEVRALDVCDYGRVAPVLDELATALGGVDIICVNAGIGSGVRMGEGGFEQDRKTIETNVIGAMATIDAAARKFRAQGHGHIVAISSVAAFRGLPSSGAYSASKAAVSVLMEALQAELYGTGIHTTTLYPGYIDTPINQRMKSRPFLITVEKGAKIIANLIEKRVVRSTVPVFPWNIVARLLRILPVSAIAKMAG